MPRSAMCLILFSYDQHPAYRLVLAANRDESRDRPTGPASFWEEGNGILAGRDLEKGGTWMGVTRRGRWAAVTNYRDLTAPQQEEAPSRGQLVTDFLCGTAEPAVFMERLAEKADQYNGFNLLVGTLEEVAYLSNREGCMRILKPGLYGLSNHLLDTDWPKVERGKQAMRQALKHETVAPEALLEIMADSTRPPDDQLPDTGLGLKRERKAAPIFISGAEYGTRSSTVLLISRAGKVTFAERSFDGREPALRRYAFMLDSSLAS